LRDARSVFIAVEVGTSSLQSIGDYCCSRMAL